MLKKVRLQNFKLHENTAVETSRITVFIGPNNSGKSSIFQALLALREAALRRNPNVIYLLETQTRRPTGPFVFPSTAMLDLGEFQDVLRRGAGELQIGLGGEVTAHDATELLEAARTVRVNFDVRVRDNRFVGHEGSIECSPGGSVRWSWTPGKPSSSTEGIFRGRSVSIHVQPSESFPLIGAQISPQPGQSFTAAEAQLFQASANFIAEAPVNLLRSLHPVFALRGFEEWGCPIADIRPGEQLERLTLLDRAVALANALAYNRNLKTELSERLESLLNIEIDIELVPGQRVKVWARSKQTRGADTLFINEGTGANQLPFILVPIALAAPGDTILLAEPEAHLHPKAQSELAAFLLRASGTQELQFLVETHSEHVLHRFLHAVAKGELALEDLAIYYFENVQGKAVVRRLEIDEKGGVAGGLPGFFDQSLEEVTEYIEALKDAKN